MKDFFQLNGYKKKKNIFIVWNEITEWPIVNGIIELSKIDMFFLYPDEIFFSI